MSRIDRFARYGTTWRRTSAHLSVHFGRVFFPFVIILTVVSSINQAVTLKSGWPLLQAPGFYAFSLVLFQVIRIQAHLSARRRNLWFQP